MVRALSATALPWVCVGGESGEALRSLLIADGLDPWMTSTSFPADPQARLAPSVDAEHLHRPIVG